MRMIAYTSPEGSSPATRALHALVRRGTPRLDQHRSEDNEEEG